MKRSLVVPGLLVLLAGAMALNYTLLTGRPFVEAGMELHRQVVEGTAPSPYRYRILVPMALDAVIRATPLSSPRLAHMAVYAVYAWFALAFSLVALHAYVRRWLPAWPALAIVLVAATTWSVAFRNHLYQPWSWLEPGIFALALSWIIDRRFALLAGLVAVATLNRETAVFLALLYLCARWDERPFARAVALALVWAAVFVGLRLWRGAAPHPFTPEFHVAGNLDPGGLARTAVNLTFLCGAIVPLAAWGFRDAPAMLRRAAWIVPPYVITVYVFAYWYEVRLLLPLSAIVLPLAGLGLMRFVGPSAEAPPGAATRST